MSACQKTCVCVCVWLCLLAALYNAPRERDHVQHTKKCCNTYAMYVSVCPFPPLSVLCTATTLRTTKSVLRGERRKEKKTQKPKCESQKSGGRRKLTKQLHSVIQKAFSFAHLHISFVNERTASEVGLRKNGHKRLQPMIRPRLYLFFSAGATRVCFLGLVYCVCHCPFCVLLCEYC